ncbi:hypothetical protein BT69DRAFT_1258672 [Atractiella rhizophila]|nr:hypothetical protein BT69DRAFT_1258672 [Atractiella rhizophila]
MELSSPGTAESFGREVRNTLLMDHFYDGARVDIAKSLSLSPLFQLSHTLTLGGMQMGPMGPQQNPGNYRFSPTFVQDDLMLQGAVEGDGTLQGVWASSLMPKMPFKVAVQLASGAMAQSRISIEQERLGKDYTLNLKMINPSPMQQTGFFQLTYLQSLSKRLTIGTELIHQRPAPGIEDSGTGYLLRYSSSPLSPFPWYTTLSMKSTGTVEAAYYHRLAPSVEMASELNLQIDPRPRNREALARVGARYEFRASQARVMVDSAGKVAAILEQKISPTLGFTVCGEIDQVKHSSRWGVGLTIESSTFTEEEMQAKAMAMQVQSS